MSWVPEDPEAGRELLREMVEAVETRGWGRVAQVEHLLWGMAQEGAPVAPGVEPLTAGQAARLRGLSGRAGGWWTFPNGFRSHGDFSGLAEWERQVAARDKALRWRDDT